MDVSSDSQEPTGPVDLILDSSDPSLDSSDCKLDASDPSSFVSAVAMNLQEVQTDHTGDSKTGLEVFFNSSDLIVFTKQ